MMGSCGCKGTGGDKAAGIPGTDGCSKEVRAHGANTTNFPFNSLGWTVACKFLLILKSSCPSGSWRKGTQSPCPSDWGALGSPWLCGYREEGCASAAVTKGWDGWAVLVESDFWWGGVGCNEVGCACICVGSFLRHYSSQRTGEVDVQPVPVAGGGSSGIGTDWRKDKEV